MKISFITNQIAALLCIALLSTACGSKKSAQISNSQLPDKLDGYYAHKISTVSPDKILGEKPVKIEIIPGKNMEVDCNYHSLMGEFKEKSLSDGNLYHVFESNGQAVSTLMGCPDNTKRVEFVKGQSIFFNSNQPIPSVIFASEGIDIKQRIWDSSDAYPMEKQWNNTIETEATKALEAYPQSLEGYDRYVLLLPEIKNSLKDRKVEIIPGKTMEVDCNHFSLGGTFVEKTINGWGYSYLIFESKGQVRSTRMACPEESKRTDIVTGATHLMDYNSRLPIVVFIPKVENLSVQYRIWEAAEPK